MNTFDNNVKVMMKRKKLNTFINFRITSLILLIFAVISNYSCNYNSTVEEEKFLDRALDVSSLLAKSHNDQEYARSTKLDSLFEIENGQYVLSDISGTSFEDYSIFVIACLNKKTTLVLFVDRNEILRDTLTFSFEEDFSVGVELSENQRGVCVGEYDEEYNRMTINDIYVLDNSIKLSKASNKSNIIRCPLPQNYLTEENDMLGETFSFRTGTNSKYRSNLDNAWNGNYELELDLIREMTEHNWKFSLHVGDKNDIFVHHKFDNETESIENVVIKSNSPNELVLISPTDENAEYILTLEGNNFYISGASIYLMNPPNERYQVFKKPKY